MQRFTRFQLDTSANKIILDFYVLWYNSKNFKYTLVQTV